MYYDVGRMGVLYMTEKVATIKLIDGSEHETVFERDITDPKSFIESNILNNRLIRVINPKNSESFDEEYIVSKNIIAFRISES